MFDRHRIMTPALRQDRPTPLSRRNEPLSLDCAGLRSRRARSHVRCVHGKRMVMITHSHGVALLATDVELQSKDGAMERKARRRSSDQTRLRWR
jgi:hypothetical protein